MHERRHLFLQESYIWLTIPATKGTIRPLRDSDSSVNDSLKCFLTHFLLETQSLQCFYSLKSGQLTTALSSVQTFLWIQRLFVLSVQGPGRVKECLIGGCGNDVIIKCRIHSGKLTTDSTHHGHHLFELLPSRRRLRSLASRTSRHRSSFLPQPFPFWTVKYLPRHIPASAIPPQSSAISSV